MGESALEGMKVLDLTRVLAGPYCSMMLADMGAEIIKVEMPGQGDDSRAFLPEVNGESAYYMNLNRNKKGITLNLKQPKGREIFLEFVKRSDILLENYRPGTMEKLGLGYDVIKEVNPSIVYGCVSGFGHYGPYSSRPGYDIIGQAMGGLMSTSGWPGGEPTRTGTAIADVLGGMNLTIGVLAAYINAKRTGKGQKVDVALVDSVVSSLEIINMIYLVTGRLPGRIGNRYESAYPYDSFKAKDGSIVIGAANNKLFGQLTKVMGMPELTEDPRFKENKDRIENHVELKRIIEAWLADKTIDGAVDTILRAGCPAAPINTIDRVVEDPHIAYAREMFVECDHPKAGKMRIAGNPVKLSESKFKVRNPAPTLGQDNDEVFRQCLGISAQEMEELKQEGVI